MANYNDLVNAMKQAGYNATEAKNPVNVCFGKVTSESPLKILVEQKITLGTAQLVLTRNVTDYELEIELDDILTENELAKHKHTVSFETTANTNEVDLKHKHKIKGKNTIKVHNALKKDEEVIMLRKQGGQKYIVIDRMVQE